MAIVDLGTFDVNIGGAPVEFTPFAFNRRRAYLLKAITTIDNPNSIFSRFQIRGIFTNANNFSVYTHHLIDLPVTTRDSVFLLPFSTLYASNGSVTIEAERLSFVTGGGDNAGNVSLNLSYDDAVNTRTWL